MGRDGSRVDAMDREAFDYEHEHDGIPGRNAPGPRLACPTGSTASSASGKQHPLPRKVARVVNWG